MTTRILFLTGLAHLALAGCFSDPGGEISGGETGTSEGTFLTETDPPGGGEATGVEEPTSGGLTATETGETEGPTSGPGSEETGTDEPTGSETGTDETTGPDTGSETGTDETTGLDTGSETDTGSSPCTPVEIGLVPGFTSGESRTITPDFDNFPGEPGEQIRVCLYFSSANAASARTITIGGELGAFGPCGGQGPAPGPFWGCAFYAKPAGSADVVVDNKTFGPDCQSGPMDDVVLAFGC